MILIKSVTSAELAPYSGDASVVALGVKGDRSLHVLPAGWQPIFLSKWLSTYVHYIIVTKSEQHFSDKFSALCADELHEFEVSITSTVQISTTTQDVGKYLDYIGIDFSERIKIVLRPEVSNVLGEFEQGQRAKAQAAVQLVLEGGGRPRRINSRGRSVVGDLINLTDIAVSLKADPTWLAHKGALHRLRNDDEVRQLFKSQIETRVPRDLPYRAYIVEELTEKAVGIGVMRSVLESQDEKFWARMDSALAKAYAVINAHPEFTNADVGMLIDKVSQLMSSNSSTNLSSSSKPGGISYDPRPKDRDASNEEQ